ncbi:hypothetical protein QQP08_020008 [Theobroma cacao]|nr:hypothetical protein QQP08_020008 [Theobroma cacao]
MEILLMIFQQRNEENHGFVLVSWGCWISGFGFDCKLRAWNDMPASPNGIDPLPAFPDRYGTPHPLLLAAQAAASTTEARRDLCECFEKNAPGYGVKPEKAKLLPGLCGVTVPVPIDPSVNCTTTCSCSFLSNVQHHIGKGSAQRRWSCAAANKNKNLRSSNNFKQEFLWSGKI